MEYPRMLYKNGDRDGENVVVKDADEEKAQREAGYRSLRDKAPAKAEGKAK